MTEDEKQTQTCKQSFPRVELHSILVSCFLLDLCLCCILHFIPACLDTRSLSPLSQLILGPFPLIQSSKSPSVALRQSDLLIGKENTALSWTLFLVTSDVADPVLCLVEERILYTMLDHCLSTQTYENDFSTCRSCIPLLPNQSQSYVYSPSTWEAGQED